MDRPNVSRILEQIFDFNDNDGDRGKSVFFKLFPVCWTVFVPNMTSYNADFLTKRCGKY